MMRDSTEDDMNAALPLLQVPPPPLGVEHPVPPRGLLQPRDGPVVVPRGLPRQLPHLEPERRQHLLLVLAADQPANRGGEHTVDAPGGGPGAADLPGEEQGIALGVELPFHLVDRPYEEGEEGEDGDHEEDIEGAVRAIQREKGQYGPT